MAQGMSAGLEFSTIRLGDRRLDRRWIRVMDKIFSAPETSLNEAMGRWCEAKAAYRIFSHPELTEEKILAAHRSQVVKRASAFPELLVLHDTTTLVFTSHVKATGLGSIAQGFKGKTSQGIFAHTAYVTDPDGMPLGLLDQFLWTRAESKFMSHPLWGSEKNRWTQAVRYTPDLKSADEKRVIHVCDREGDYWDLMKEIHAQGDFFVIRLVQRRGIKKIVQSTLGAAPILGEIEAEIDLREKNSDPKLTKFHVKRTRSRIRFELTFAEFDLSPTTYRRDLKNLNRPKVTMVRAREKNPPPGRECIEWILKTNLTIETLADAKRVVEIYSRRWRIEMFHKALKSGCLVEKSRLATAERLKKYITAMSVAAWRLSALSLLSRENPNDSCETVLSKAQWVSLYCRTHGTSDIPKTPPTLEKAVAWIAQMGGHMGRKRDGPPGMITLWRGWNKLCEMTALYEALMQSR